MKSKFPEKKVMTRYFIVAAFLAAIGVGVAIKTAYIMFVERNFWNEVSQRFVKRNMKIAPVRGSIYSADGQLLASSIPEYKMFMDYMVVEKDSARRVKAQNRRDSILYASVDSMSDGLHAIFPDKSAAEFKRTLLEGRKKESRNWPIYSHRITYIQYKEVKRLPVFRLPAYKGGFHVQTIEQRANPFGSLAKRTIGALYAGKDSARYGLELAFDSVLRGKPGLMHRQKVMNKYLNIIDRPQEDGCDIISTIDVNMQDLAEKALVDKLKEIDAPVGIVALMEVKTGDVKAIVNMERGKNGSYHETKNYAVSNLLEPGSVFKTASFMVAFDDGMFRPDDLVNTGCGKVNMHGRDMKDVSWKNGGKGVITAAECIKYSSNVGVSMLIDKYYFNQPEKFVNGLYRIGIAEPYEIDIPGAAKANIRRLKKDRSNWSKTALAWMSIGYETQIPPIRTLAFYNGIANGGKMLAPRFVKALKRNGELVEDYPVKVVRERMCSPTALRDIQYCLSLVTQKKGSGHRAASKFFPISGKTGTAQIWTKSGRTTNYLISFVGYFPANAPKYSCIVCIQKSFPASGGGHCGPVFKRIAEGVMAHERNENISSARDTVNRLQPFVHGGDMSAARNVLSELHIPYTSSGLGSKTWGYVRNDSTGITLTGEGIQSAGKVPDLKNMGLRDAVFVLESMGLKVSAKGKGRVVEQSVPAGTAAKKGLKVNITLKTAAEIRADEKTHAVPAPAPAVSESENAPQGENENAQKKVDSKQPENNKASRENSKASNLNSKARNLNENRPRSEQKSGNSDNKQSASKSEASAGNTNSGKKQQNAGNNSGKSESKNSKPSAVESKKEKNKKN